MQSQDDRPRHRSIQPVWDAQVGLPWLVIALLDESLELRFQAVNVWRSLCQQASWLIDYQAGTLFIEDLVVGWQLGTHSDNPGQFLRGKEKKSQPPGPRRLARDHPGTDPGRSIQTWPAAGTTNGARYSRVSISLAFELPTISSVLGLIFNGTPKRKGVLS